LFFCQELGILFFHFHNIHYKHVASVVVVVVDVEKDLGRNASLGDTRTVPCV